MIWFGNLNRILATEDPQAYGPLSEPQRMLQALRAVAERAPHLSGAARVEALAATGWVDLATAQRLLPTFIHFDPDRHFSDYLRSLSFRGRSAAQEFREGVRCIVEELTGDGNVGEVGPETGIRFRADDREGIVLAHPEVSFTISGNTREAVSAAVEEMPDALIIVARNFERGAADQLASILSRTGVPGTLLTVNLLLGIRAMKLRYRPAENRVIELLGTGRPLRSSDIARLGERETAAA